MEKLDNVVSSNAVIIDKCISYFNLSREIIKNTYIKIILYIWINIKGRLIQKGS